MRDAMPSGAMTNEGCSMPRAFELDEQWSFEKKDRSVTRGEEARRGGGHGRSDRNSC